MNLNKTFLVALLSILFFAAVLRLADLDSLPAGLNGDEALEGLDALRIISGARPVFLEGSDPREPLYAYLVALSVKIFGRTPGAVRLPAATAGIGAIMGIYLVADSLFNRRTGLMAALISTFTVWPILISRNGVPTSLLPLVLSFSLWSGIKGWQTGRIRYWVFSGLLMGLAHYIYPSARVIVLTLPLWAAILCLTGHGHTLWPGAVYFAGILGLSVTPLAIHTLNISGGIHLHDVQMSTTSIIASLQSATTHLVQGLINYRPRLAMVSAIDFTDSPREIIINIAEQTYIVMQMFVMKRGGDLNWRHNIASRPVFDIIMASAFVSALILSLSREKRLTIWLCGLWVGVGLLPVIFSKQPPYFNRATAILPVLFIWPAIGLNWIYQRLTRLFIHQVIALISVGILLLGSIFITVRDYSLDSHLARPIVAAAFQLPLTDRPLAVNQFLGVGWQGDSLFAQPDTPNPNRQVWIEPSLWGSDWQQEFLVPLTPDTDFNFRFVDLSLPSLPPDLADEILFIVSPGQEKRLEHLLSSRYSITIGDPEWIEFEGFPDVHPWYRFSLPYPHYQFVYALVVN